MKRFLCVFICFILLSGCVAETEKVKKTEEEIRAIWVSVYDLGEFRGISEGGFRAKAENMFRDIKEKGFDHVFLQLRPCSDALYKSGIFPWSEYISEEQGKSPGYDPLNIFLDVAHSHKLKLHAWINPYRISATSADIEKLSDTNPARKMYAENKSDIYFTSEGIYYNPASLRVQKLILDGVREIVNNYPVDGIHIDDFFYPDTDTAIDAKEFEEYKNNSGRLSLEEFRRKQVNAFVAEMYSIAKNKNEKIIVSISPSADINKNMNKLFADVKTWAENKGFCDWIIPQVYYGFENETFPFEETVESWKNLVDEKRVRLIIGLASYKCGEKDFYAGKGRDEWKEKENILAEQLEFIRKKECSGFAVFSYGSIHYPNAIMEKEWENFSKEISSS